MINLPSSRNQSMDSKKKKASKRSKYAVITSRSENAPVSRLRMLSLSPALLNWLSADCCIPVRDAGDGGNDSVKRAARSRALWRCW